MDSPVRIQLKKNDYLRHKFFRTLNRRKKRLLLQLIEAPEKELRRRLRLKRYEGGKDDQERIDASSEIKWIKNWLQNRRDILAKNAEATSWAYSKYYPENENAQDVRDSGFKILRYGNLPNPLSYFKNSTPTRNRINKLIYSQVENALNTPKVKVGHGISDDYNLLGIYVEPNFWNGGGNYVAFAGNPSPSVIVHELTHASHPTQQEDYIRDIIFNGNVPKVTPNNKFGVDDNVTNAKEIYGALLEFRFKNKLDPRLWLDINWIKRNHDLFKHTYLENISDEQKLRLFNEVAYNKNQNSEQLLYARTGKDSGIHIKPENRGKFNALKKRTGKTTEELTHSKNPLTRKRAIFALNARKWNHKK